MNDAPPNSTPLSTSLEHYRLALERLQLLADGRDPSTASPSATEATDPIAEPAAAPTVSALPYDSSAFDDIEREGEASDDRDRILPLTERLAPLLARDRVQLILADTPTPTADELDPLLQLDRRLQDSEDLIFINQDIAECRDRLAPEETAWWWFFEIKDSAPPPKYLTQLDGLWNLGSAICLAFAATFITQTVKAFSTRGFDILGTVGTIAQGAGLALVARGTLTDTGKEKLHETLDSLGLPESLHQEMTFLVAAGMLAGSYSLHQNLYRFSDYYYNLGKQQESEQKWGAAQNSYARAMDFNSGNHEALLGRGSLLEKLGEYEQAAEIYQQGIPSGKPHFFNALGRSLLRESLQKNGWQGPLDRAVLSNTNSLFARARIRDSTTHDSALATDVYLNRGQAAWASVDFNAPTNTPAADRALFEAIEFFQRAISTNEAAISEWIDLNGPVDATTIYPWQLLRAQCFDAAAEAFALMMDVPPELIPDPTYVKGLDPRLATAYMSYSCNELLTDRDEVDAANNSILVESILRSERITPFVQSANRGFQHIPQIDPEASERQARILETLLSKLETARDVPLTSRMPLSNRVVVDANTNIVAIYAYDIFSLSKLVETPTYLLQEKQTDEVGPPVADFWVHFHPLKPIEVVPWYERYAVDRTAKQMRWNGQLPVQPRPEERQHVGELALLRVLAYTQLQAYGHRARDWKPLLDRKLIYQLFLAADGRIVGYKPSSLNDGEATSRLT